MSEAFLCDAVRTPFSRYGGARALSGVRADQLGAAPIKALLARNPSLDGHASDDMILGCANQAGEDNRNVARMAALRAGLPVEVPGVTVNRLCGPGREAVVQEARAIRCGKAALVVAGGVESATAMDERTRTSGRYALCTMCIGDGQGIAVVIERV
jgi:acetyl-CoA acetyltransferase